MELTDDPEHPGGGGPVEPIAPCLANADERAVFFTKSSDFGTDIHCYIWYTKSGNTTQVCGNWPGKKATDLGNGNYKFVVPEAAAAIDDDWMIIWNDGSGNQTKDLKFQLHYLYSGANKNAIAATTKITAICETTDLSNHQSPITNRKWLIDGRLYIQIGDKLYDATGRLVTTNGGGNLPAR